MTSRVVSRALVVVLLGVASVAGALTSTGQDASQLPFVACNGRVGFRTSEAQQGHTDLNGDGDANDVVLQVLDLGSGIVTNVGVDASGALACSGDVFVFGVSEAAQGNADRNGDGDTFDQVLAAYNANTATLTNLHLAVSTIAASPALVAFTVGEASQGGADRNGDGDVLDQVLAVLDPTTLSVTNVGFEADDASNIEVNGSRVAFVTSETAQGSTDLNGDGDPLDTVVLFYDAGTATLVNPHRAIVPALGIALDSTVAAFVVSEAAQGNASLNGDLDAADQVIQAYCFGGAPCLSSGLVDVGVDAGGGFQLAGDLLAFRTREASEPGGSLNVGDTDRNDRVLQYWRFSTGTVTDTGFASQGSFLIVGSHLAFGVPEGKQGHLDRNGDGDARDIVLAIYDTVGHTTTNTGRALWNATCRPEPTSPRPRGACLVAGADMVVFPTGERFQGRTDLNGDLDTTDAVLGAWDVTAGTLVPSTLAGEHKTTIVAGGTLAAFRVSEANQGGTNLNGDLDARDAVLAVYDDVSKTYTVLPRAVDTTILVVGRTVVFRTSEVAQNADLNGDGDLNDAVLEYQTF